MNLNGSVFRSMVAGVAVAISTCAAHGAGLSVTSRAFEDGATIPRTYAGPGQCGGENVSLPVEWAGAPESTQSFVVTLEDPNGPKGTGVTHWIAYNVGPNVHDIPAGKLQSTTSVATVGKNMTGAEEYRGPCPPVGENAHHYVLTVTATDLPVGSLPGGLDTDGLRNRLKGHTLTGSTIIGRFAR